MVIKLLKQKKGDMPSILVGITVLFVIALSVIFFSHAFVNVLEEMSNQSRINESNETLEIISQVKVKTIPYLDYFFFFSFFAIIIGLIVSAVYIDVNPVFFIVFLIMFIIAIVLGGLYANTFAEVIAEEEIAGTANRFTLTTTIMNIYPVLIFAVGLIVIVILYGKSRRGGEPI